MTMRFHRHPSIQNLPNLKELALDGALYWVEWDGRRWEISTIRDKGADEVVWRAHSGNDSLRASSRGALKLKIEGFL